ncbi:hypothetical protein [Aeromonas bivalvium]|uniref:hypothetical protein n=1 Tax=Aeromonas bivalvium TaxID=440079 RepID=UPI0038D206DD
MEVEFKSWFITATIASIVIGFVTGTFSGYKQYGNRYMGVILGSWGRILVTLLPFLIYIVISIFSSGWSKIFHSPEIAMASFLIFLMSNQELGCALAVQRNYPIERYKVSIISIWSLSWLCAALVSVIFIFQTDQIPLVAVLWQLTLLIVAIFTYFGSAAVVKLVEVGHTPRKLI